MGALSDTPAVAFACKVALHTRRFCGGGAGKPAPPHSREKTAELLDLDGGACLLELRLDRVGLVLGDAFLDRLRGRVDQVLRLLEAEAEASTPEPGEPPAEEEEAAPATESEAETTQEAE